MSTTPPLAKYLASNEKSVRDKAIKNLSLFLSDPTRREPIGQRDLAKLWKGIWFCFWMSDKPLVQQALARDLSELVLSITTTPASLDFLRGFWLTSVREWNGIDRYRLDKFYMITRRFVNAAFRMLMRTGWSSEPCREWNVILMEQGGPLCPDDIRIPVGLTFHLTDIYLEELDKVLAPPSPPAQPPPPTPLSTLLLPFFLLFARTQSKPTRVHLQRALIDPLLDALHPTSASPVLLTPSSSPAKKRRRVDANAAKNTDTTPAPTYANIVANACTVDPLGEGRVDRTSLRAALLRKMFEVAGEEETRVASRKKMFAVFKENMDDAGRDSDEDMTS